MRKILKNHVLKMSQRARQKRGELFRQLFHPTEDDRILDLGGGNGAHIASIIPYRKNVYIADILQDDLKYAHEQYGFQTVVLEEGKPLPFPDKYFDIVFCSSVIEHVTIPKAEIYTCTSGREFAQRSWESQTRFANEIRRLGKRYWVQTPHRYFIIEAHTWLPMPVALMPRPMLLKFIPLLNRVWIKQTHPDWYLLTPRQMKLLFPEAQILLERFGGLPKSIVAEGVRKRRCGWVS